MEIFVRVLIFSLRERSFFGLLADVFENMCCLFVCLYVFFLENILHVRISQHTGWMSLGREFGSTSTNPKYNPTGSRWTISTVVSHASVVPVTR